MRPHVFLRDRDAEAALGASPSIEGWIESLPLPALVADEAAYVLLANRAALRFFGYHERELHGMPLERLIPELAQDADSRRAIFAKLEREAGEEATARLRNDETVPVGYGLNLIDWGGRPATAISFFDLSACKRADRERERTILDATSAVIYVKGADGRYPSDVARVSLVNGDRHVTVGLRLGDESLARDLVKATPDATIAVEGLDEAVSYSFGVWSSALETGVRYAFRALKGPRRRVWIYELTGRLQPLDMDAVSCAASLAILHLVGLTIELPDGWADTRVLSAQT